jgi:putative holliday junction resolvase
VSQPYCVVPEISRGQADLLRSGVRLAVDLGSARIGIASSDPGGLLASPLTTVRRSKGDIAAIVRLAADRQAIEIVVGLPTSLSGRPGHAAGLARQFAEALATEAAPLPVRLVDERFTTVIAHSALRAAGRDSRQRRRVVDQAAAASLLQGALDAERATGGPPGDVVRAAHGGGA